MRAVFWGWVMRIADLKRWQSIGRHRWRTALAEDAAGSGIRFHGGCPYRPGRSCAACRPQPGWVRGKVCRAARGVAGGRHRFEMHFPTRVNPLGGRLAYNGALSGGRGCSGGCPGPLRVTGTERSPVSGRRPARPASDGVLTGNWGCFDKATVRRRSRGVASGAPMHRPGHCRRDGPGRRPAHAPWEEDLVRSIQAAADRSAQLEPGDGRSR